MDNIGKIDLINHKEYKKSAIFMRMSDDVLSLLEKYALNQNDSSSKLTIKFDDSKGVIKMPNGEIVNFSITGSTAGNDSTYCVQETENRALEAVALVHPQKIIIEPSVDSFEKTRSKLTLQRKVNLCREVEPPNSFIKIGSKKVTAKCSSTFQETPNSLIINGNENKRLIHHKDFDIVSQCLRKRIIHMLALRPYKRAELLNTLVKEGISEFEKKHVYPTLYCAGILKGEIFHLDAKLWNEVEDDWRFYSPEDAAIVKKKKQEAYKTDVNLVLQNPVLKKPSLVDEIIASSGAIEKKQKKIRVDEKKPDHHFEQYRLMNSTPQNYCGPAPQSKESDDQITFPPSSGKKHKKNRKRNRKKNKQSSFSLINSEEIRDLPSTVKNKIKHDLKDSVSRSLELLSLSSSASPSSQSVSSFSHSTFASSSLSPSAPPSSQSTSAPPSSQSTSAPPSSQSTSAPLSSHSASPSNLQFASISSSLSASASSHAASASSHSPSTRSIMRSMYEILKNPSSDPDANWRRNFCKITSWEQRESYKEIFDFESPLYNTLKETSLTAERRMSHLEENLKQFSEGTQEYEAALMTLYQAYKMYFQNTGFRGYNRLLLHLHEKLCYISNLVSEFDKEHSSDF